jgi:uncharacterized protein YuzE
MTYDPEADAAYIYVTGHIEPGGSKSSNVLAGRRPAVPS